MSADGRSVIVDDQTIAFYDTASFDYAAKCAQPKPDAQLQAFMALLSDGGYVVDPGYGPAFAAAHLRNAGFSCDLVDSSEGVITVANNFYQIGARKPTCDEIDMVTVHDGVWANFSLLHAARDDLPRYLKATATALRPTGPFHVGLKVGTGAVRDKINRFYTYVTVPELTNLLQSAGFTILATELGEGPGMASVVEPWVAMRARKDPDA